MAERCSAIHFCPLLPTPAGAEQRTTDNVKTLWIARIGMRQFGVFEYNLFEII
jgi:hypothetical protein